VIIRGSPGRMGSPGSSRFSAAAHRSGWGSSLYMAPSPAGFSVSGPVGGDGQCRNLRPVQHEPRGNVDAALWSRSITAPALIATVCAFGQRLSLGFTAPQASRSLELDRSDQQTRKAFGGFRTSLL